MSIFKIHLIPQHNLHFNIYLELDNYLLMLIKVKNTLKLGNFPHPKDPFTHLCIIFTESPLTFTLNLKPNIMKNLKNTVQNLVPILTMLFLSVQIQAKTITGTVSDDTDPLPGVNVWIQGTDTGTKTDFDGRYSIEANVGDIIQYSFVGMENSLKTVGNSSVINVIMQGGAVLEEVVVTALGMKREKRPFTSVFRRKKSKKPAYPVYSTNESYKGITENSFKTPTKTPLSTFSIDVDKASYSNIRRMINNGENVPEDAVKIEEMINYFNYNYPQPTDKHPFSITTEFGACPWNAKHQLVKIGLQGKDIATDKLPASNLVFLIDVSGSMSSQNKLPLLKSAFKLLVNQLREIDKVSIVVYAGAAGVVLEPTSGANKQKILEALNSLASGGSTAGGEGIELAYQLAEKHFKKGGNNRVILATDGDFNVGASTDKDLEDLIVEKRKTGVYLTVLGFGMGNYKDDNLETLADKGNGNHAYIDTMQEAQRILGQEFGGTLFTIAKDVKIQVEFNPNQVQAYRLIGYENRLLNDEDFIDDTIDAGEIGSGHSVTALYEIIPIGVKSKFTKNLPKLKYSKTKHNSDYNDELLTVKFRYKKPNKRKSIELIKVVPNSISTLSKDFEFAAAVAMFGMELRNSKFKENTNYKTIINLAKKAKGEDENGYKSEFIRLVKTIM